MLNIYFYMKLLNSFLFFTLFLSFVTSNFYIVVCCCMRGTFETLQVFFGNHQKLAVEMLSLRPSWYSRSPDLSAGHREEPWTDILLDSGLGRYEGYIIKTTLMSLVVKYRQRSPKSIKAHSWLMDVYSRMSWVTLKMKGTSMAGMNIYLVDILLMDSESNPWSNIFSEAKWNWGKGFWGFIDQLRSIFRNPDSPASTARHLKQAFALSGYQCKLSINKPNQSFCLMWHSEEKSRGLKGEMRNHFYSAFVVFI